MDDGLLLIGAGALVLNLVIMYILIKSATATNAKLDLMEEQNRLLKEIASKLTKAL